MRRIVSGLLCALLLLGVCPAARAAEDGVSIGSRAELLRLAQDPAGSYVLTSDIDMGGEAWTPIPFSGKLDGRGHTLYNLTVTAPGPDAVATYDGNLKTYETVFGGLFSVLTNGEVRGLNLVNAVIEVETDRHCFLGGLAGYAEHSLVADCSVQVRNRLTLSSVNAGVGGLVGFCVECDFSNCTVDAELVFRDVDQSVLCEEFLGGVYASGAGCVDGCAVRTRGFAEVYGYAHSGGLVGMYKPPKDSRYKGHVNNTTADTEISFFEVSPSRRAYCSPTIGEDLKRDCARKEMITLHYVRTEAKKPRRLDPEACATPQYTQEVTPGTCTLWGCTTHTCAVCGYSYKDAYTPPQHQYAQSALTPATCTAEGERVLTCTLCGDRITEAVPALGHEYVESVTEPTCTQPGEKAYTCARCGDRHGEPIPARGHVPGAWTRTTAPQVDKPGEEQQLCQVCGAVLGRREVAALPRVYAQKVTLSAGSLSLTVDETAQLTAALAPADVTDPGLTFLSSDMNVVTVTNEGRVLAVSPGTATVTAASADGRASATCTVTVSYTNWQWVKHYILFGWAWE